MYRSSLEAALAQIEHLASENIELRKQLEEVQYPKVQVQVAGRSSYVRRYWPYFLGMAFGGFLLGIGQADNVLSCLGLR